MSQLWQVALRELRQRGRSKAYLITSGLILMMVLGLVIVPQFFEGDTDEYQVGLVGSGNEVILAASTQLANANDEPDGPPSVEFTTSEYPDRGAAETALAAGEVVAVLVDGEEVVVERAAGWAGSPLLSLLQRGAATVELERLLAEEGQAAADVVEVMTSDPLKATALSGEDPEDEAGGVAAYVGLLLLYIAILLYGTWILTGVTEEKTNRVVEVLLSSIRPWQLLGGKIVGIGTLGLVQFAGTIIVAVIAVQLTGVFDIPSVSGATVFNLVLWFFIGFVIFAFMFGAAGSLVSRQEDAQNIALPMTLAAVIGFFLSLTALNEPDGVAAVVGTFVPITAPFVVPVRASLNAIPWWQYGAAVILSMATAVGLMFIGGRIYAGGVLRFGRKVGYREAWRSGTE